MIAAARMRPARIAMIIRNCCEPSFAWLMLLSGFVDSSVGLIISTLQRRSRIACCESPSSLPLELSKTIARELSFYHEGERISRPMSTDFMLFELLIDTLFTYFSSSSTFSIVASFALLINKLISRLSMEKYSKISRAFKPTSCALSACFNAAC